MSNVEIVDRREKFSMVGDKFTKEYMRKVGGNGAAAYLALMFFANNSNGAVWPSQDTIAEMMGTTRKTAGVACKKLAEYNIVSIKERFTETGRRTSNLIELLPSSVWGMSKNYSVPQVKITQTPEYPIPTNHTNIEPNQIALKEEEAPAPSPVPEPAPKPKPRRKPKARQPAAVHTYRAVFSLFPTKATWPTLDKAIGDDPAHLGKWETVCKAWNMQQNNPKNLTGLLDWFKDGIPDYAKPGGPTNGNHKTRQTSIPGLRSEDSQVEKRVNLATRETYWVSRETGERVSPPV